VADDDNASLATVAPGSDIAPGLPPVELPSTSDTPQRPRITVSPSQTRPPPPPKDTSWTDDYRTPPANASPPGAPKDTSWTEDYRTPPSNEAPPEVGTGEAAGYGALNALSFGAAPAIAGAASLAPHEWQTPDIYTPEGAPVTGPTVNPAAPFIGAAKMLNNWASSHPDPTVTAAYNKGREDYLRTQNAAQEQHGLAYLGGQLAGSLLSPSFAMRAATIPGRIGAGALAGGIGGGLYGAGTGIGAGEEPSDIAKDTLTGATMGAPLGGALGAIAPRFVNPNSPGQQAAATAQRLGAPLPRGIVSDSPGVNALTARLQSLPFSGIKERVGNTIEAAGEHLGNLSADLTQGIDDRSTADAIVRPAIQSVVDRNKAAINTAYNGVRNSIDLTQHYTLPTLKSELQNVITDRANAGWDHPEQGLDQFQNLVNGATFNGLHRARVDARSAGNVLAPHPGYNKADYNRLTRAMTKDLRSIVYTAAKDPTKRPDTLAAFDTAEQQFGRLADQNDNLHKLINKPGEATIATLLRAAKEKGGNLALVNQLRNSMNPDDFQLIGGTLLRELGYNPTTANFSLAKLVSEWNKISDGAKRALFSPDHLKDINEVVGMGKQLKGALKETNTSHTANALLAFEMMEKMAELGMEAASGHLSQSTLFGTGATMAAWPVARFLASPAKAKAMSNWSRAHRAMGLGEAPVRRAAFNEATRQLGHELGIVIDPSQYFPTGRATGGRVWQTRAERVRDILERYRT
jgi:hypothetical protein